MCDEVYVLFFFYNFYDYRFFEQILLNVVNVVGECGGEEDVLAACGQEGEDAVHFFFEAEGEHFVGFVEYEDVDFGEVNGFGVDEVEQAAWGSDEDGGTVEVHHLRVDGDTTVNGHGLYFPGQVFAEDVEGFIDLNGEFAGGDDDEATYVAIACQGFALKLFEHGQYVTSGFSGPCFGDSEDVSAIE